MTRIEKEKDKITVYLKGELDHHAARMIREEVDEILRSSLPKLLVMDFSGVPFMDSSGIGLILGRYKLIRTMGGEVVIRGATEAVRRMIELSGLKSIIEIEE